MRTQVTYLEAIETEMRESKKIKFLFKTNLQKQKRSGVEYSRPLLLKDKLSILNHSSVF